MEVIKEEGCGIVKIVFIYPLGNINENEKMSLQMMCKLFKKGTSKLNNFQLNTLIEEQGINIDIYSSMLYTTIEVNILKEKLINAIPIIHDVIYDANFEIKDFNTAVNQRIDEIKQNNLQIENISFNRLFYNIFGENQLGYINNVEDLKLLNSKIIKDIYLEKFININPKIFIAGDVDDDILKSIKNYFYKKENKNAKSTDLLNFLENDKKPFLDTLNIKLKNKQNCIQYGKVFVYKNEKELYHYNILNNILGESFNSRLMRKLRTELGLTYGAYSSIIVYPKFFVFNISTLVNKRKTKIVLDEINNILFRFINIEYKEYEMAKKSLLSQWYKKNDNSINKLNQLIEFYKLNLDYNAYNSYIQDMELNEFKHKSIPTIDLNNCFSVVV